MANETRNYNAVLKSVAIDGFFSEFLPPCFRLTDEVLSFAPSKNCDLIEPYSFTMSRHNNNDARRIIYIPEIGAYASAIKFIKDKSIIQEIIEFAETSDVSFSSILDSNDNIVRLDQTYESSEEFGEISSNYIENIAQRIIKSAGAKKILKLDISNCYSSFYIHMLPAILLGLEEAEKNYQLFKTNDNSLTVSPTYLKYKELDDVLRKQNQNRTNGLLPGPYISFVIAEGYLSRIDKELLEEGIRYTRYVDDYDIYILDEDTDMIINRFTKIIKKYCFTLNYEKTVVMDFPFYLAQNLNKLVKDHTKSGSEITNNNELIELFNKFYTLENNGTKGAIRYLLKCLANAQIATIDTALYKAHLLTIINNNTRSLTKACELLIDNQAIKLNEKEIAIIKRIIGINIQFDYDLEVIWLLYLLIKTGKIHCDNTIVNLIVNSRNELAHTMLFREKLLDDNNIEKIKKSAKSWFLLYELYADDYLSEEEFKSRLALKKNLGFYVQIKKRKIHFYYLL